MKTVKLIFLFLITSTFAVYSQGGSNFSVIGIGDINYFGNSAYAGLAGTQMAFPAEYSINMRNPAMWSFVTNTRLQAGYKFNQNIVSTNESTIWHNNGAISGFSGIFAMDSTYSIASSFGIVPYSSVNYLTATKTKITDFGLELDGETQYQGTGGLSQAYIGLSGKITDYIGIGAMINTTFGVIEANRLTSFNNDFYSFRYQTTKSDYVSGFGSKIGAFITPVKDLIIGVSYELSPNFGITSETNYKSPTITDTTISVDNEITVPSMFGLGASYSSGNFIFGADLMMQDFTNFNYNPGANTKFTNSIITSIGVNRIGNPSVNAPLADRISYKFGAGYNHLYYKVLGNQIQEYIGSVGMQIPFAGSMVVDFSFILGYRSSGDSRLVNEYFGRFGFDISIGETWFKPFMREFD